MHSTSPRSAKETCWIISSDTAGEPGPDPGLLSTENLNLQNILVNILNRFQIGRISLAQDSNLKKNHKYRPVIIRLIYGIPFNIPRNGDWFISIGLTAHTSHLSTAHHFLRRSRSNPRSSCKKKII